MQLLSYSDRYGSDTVVYKIGAGPVTIQISYQIIPKLFWQRQLETFVLDGARPQA